jgi:hypothetical protein
MKNRICAIEVGYSNYTNGYFCNIERSNGIREYNSITYKRACLIAQMAGYCAYEQHTQIRPTGCAGLFYI